MFVDYSDDQKALRAKLRKYFSNLIKPDYKEELRSAEGGDLYKSLIRQMGKDNMLALGWPKEYGGEGLTPTEQLIFFEEALLACAPVPFVTLNTVGPAVMDHGTEEQKKKHEAEKARAGLRERAEQNKRKTEVGGKMIECLPVNT